MENITVLQRSIEFQRLDEKLLVWFLELFNVTGCFFSLLMFLKQKREQQPGSGHLDFWTYIYIFAREELSGRGR